MRMRTTDFALYVRIALIQMVYYFFIALLAVSKIGGVKSLMAENMLLRQQLITLNRSRKRGPKLTMMERLNFAFLTGLINPDRLKNIGIIIKPSTLFKLHKALIKRKYRRLFSNKSAKKPGPEGPNQELIDAIMAMKQRNPRYGCQRIAMQINNLFGLNINKDVVRRVLAKYSHPSSGGDGPSWLTFIGHMKDSLWSVDFFRTESIVLKSHWVMVVMDQFTRRIIGFATHQGDINDMAACVMFNKIRSAKTPPKYLSSDNDPIFQFSRWKANLRILEVKEIKSLPYQPRSHPFVERLIKTCRNELLDRTFFWTELDLQRKLDQFKQYFNEHRTHMALQGRCPKDIDGIQKTNVIDINYFQWKSHCRGLFQLPSAA